MWISTKINQWFLPSRWPGLFRQPQLHQGRLRKTTYIHGVPQYNYLSFPMYSWIFSPGLFHSIYNDRLGAFGPPCRGLFFHGRLDFLGYAFLVSFTCPGLGLRKLKKTRMTEIRNNNEQYMVSNILYFHLYLGRLSKLTHFFQTGWFNHQLEKIRILHICWNVDPQVIQAVTLFTHKRWRSPTTCERVTRTHHPKKVTKRIDRTVMLFSSCINWFARIHPSSVAKARLDSQ